jgi:mono/diheme cytochrome c family protein
MMKRLILAITLLPSVALAGESGQSLYEHKCATCHQIQGGGIAHAFPALAGDATLLGDEEDLIALVFRGRGGMPSWAFFLNDQQVADILSYARGAWGNAAPPVTAEQVAALRKTVVGAAQNPLGN